MAELIFRNVRSKRGSVWLRHAGWETRFQTEECLGHYWSASEIHWHFMRGVSVQELAQAKCDCGLTLTAEQVETALRHEFKREAHNAR